MASTVVSQLKKALSVSKGKTIEEVLKTFNDSGGVYRHPIKLII